MPYTTVVSGTTITAAYGNANIRDQVVTPFASASARTSAITSPVTGMVTHRADENTIEFYDGASWIPAGWKPIAQTTLGGSAATVTINNIPATYKHLLVAVSARGDTVANNVDINIQFNGDAGANYSFAGIFHTALGTGGYDGASGATSSRLLLCPGAAFGTATTFGGGYMQVLEYTSTTSITKIAHAHAAYMDAGNAGNAVRRAGGWKPTSAAAITQIAFLASAGNFIANSVFRIYGAGAA